MNINMNKILLLTGVITLLTTTGCIFPGGGGGGRDGDRHDGPRAVIVAPVPVVVVRHDHD
jgi:hypothetical protein